MNNIAGNYARALVKSNGGADCDAIYKDFLKLFSGSEIDFTKLVHIYMDRKLSRDFFGMLANELSFSKPVKRLAAILIDNMRINYFFDIAKEYISIYNTRHGIYKVDLIVDAESMGQKKSIDKLRIIFGKKCQFNTKQSKKFIGGLKMIINDNFMLDITLTYYFTKLKNFIGDKINENIAI